MIVIGDTMSFRFALLIIY